MTMPVPIYLDHNATTPVDPRAAEAALPYLTTHFGNPASAHAYGETPRRAVARARDQVAALLGAAPGEIVFTGGGSESDTLAIRGAALALRGSGRTEIVTQPTEHPAVLEACRALAADGFTTALLPVDAAGRVAVADLQAALSRRTALVTIAHANGETGTLQPIRALAAAARRAGAVFHTDAAQSVAKVPIDVTDLGVDLLTLAGHKMYAPKGVGALYVRSGTPMLPVVPGGGQEGGLRAGTENVPWIAALGVAAEIAAKAVLDDGPRLARLRDLLHDELAALLPGRVHLNGHPGERLPGTLNVSIDGTDGRALLATVPEIAASTGSACHEGATAPSPVLIAMGVPHVRAASAIRLSLGRGTTEDDIREAARLLAARCGRSG
ncbi:cysteine desulfurase family protein [Spongiactinospora sp. TRM90649]|uniref:cysteine desulfurase family protein n=1 Tax=Spongiactinospora sp. TRM90649 TaxID=3031114 RepID=UPI0023F93880|nr:cysteine desulfurase family protein [Spongiactinospora sp. TRM90649]MDF5753650.1 cysteine desulfurase family protein [Spongiactinospora sp. TRM90649]